jgi:RNA polymerase sigma-70 factor (ECF subfamily)
MNRLPDNNAFLELIEANKGLIFKICHSYCPNKNEREDLVQEIIYQLWKSYPNYKPDFKFSTWMYRVALNVAISFYRKEKTATNTIILTEHLIEYEIREDDSAQLEENIRLLYQFIHGFNEFDRALIILYLEDKSHKEIAEILGITQTNVATRVGRLKDKLKQNFATLKN